MELWRFFLVTLTVPGLFHEYKYKDQGYLTLHYILNLKSDAAANGMSDKAIKIRDLSAVGYFIPEMIACYVNKV